ncbi:hypothetical protein CRUP_029430 [Coryphaenoides rupestris]|nr:hypothetical protein CRUP_029430 [Coryphaenoides rupestris]
MELDPAVIFPALLFTFFAIYFASTFLTKKLETANNNKNNKKKTEEEEDEQRDEVCASGFVSVQNVEPRVAQQLQPVVEEEAEPVAPVVVAPVVVEAEPVVAPVVVESEPVVSVVAPVVETVVPEHQTAEVEVAPEPEPVPEPETVEPVEEPKPAEIQPETVSLPELVVESIAASETQSAPEPVEPAVVALTEPLVESIPEPETKSLPEPEAKSVAVAEPVAETVAEPVLAEEPPEAVAQPQAEEPVIVAEPVVVEQPKEAVEEPVVVVEEPAVVEEPKEVTAEPEPTPEPKAQPEPKPEPEPVPDCVPESTIPTEPAQPTADETPVLTEPAPELAPVVLPEEPSAGEDAPQINMAAAEEERGGCPWSVRKAVRRLPGFLERRFNFSTPVFQWAGTVAEPANQRLGRRAPPYGWKGIPSDVVRSALALLSSPSSSHLVKRQSHGRVNGAVTRGFEPDVGNKTSFYGFTTNTLKHSLVKYKSAGFTRIPQGPGIHYIFIPSGIRDYVMLASALQQQSVPAGEDLGDRPWSYFGKSSQEHFRMLHPDFITYVRDSFLKSPLMAYPYTRDMYMPSTGALMLFTALHTCDQVSAYGFITGNYALFSDHYFDPVMTPLQFYANHDLKMEARLSFSWCSYSSFSASWLLSSHKMTCLHFSSTFFLSSSLTRSFSLSSCRLLFTLKV